MALVVAAVIKANLAVTELSDLSSSNGEVRDVAP